MRMSGLPVDKGWAWMCCLGAAVNMFFVVGGLRSVGLLFIEIVEMFHSTRVITSMTVAFLAAGFAILAPISNALGMKFTMRSVVFIGGSFTAASAFMTSFAPNIYYIIVVFGCWTGIGYGMMFGPSMVVVGLHFKQRRSLANGLAAAGGSLGQLVIPQLLNVLIKEYSFQGCMLIYSAIILHALPAAMLYRPLSFYLRGKPVPKIQSQSTEESVTEHKLHSPEINDHRDGSLLKINETNNHYNGLETKDNSTDLHSHENLPFLKNEDKHLPIRSDLSKSKQSLYASTSSLYFAPHQSAPPEMIENEKCGKTKSEGQATQKGTFNICGICRIFEWSLFHNWLFVIYVAGLSCGHGGYINLCMFYPPYAAEYGLQKQDVALLLSIVGISDLIGRVFGGWFADLGFIKRSNIMAVCLSFTGGCAVLVPLLPNFATFAVFSVIVGMIGGVYVSLMVAVIIDFLGLEKLASSFGLATMCMGLATIPVPLVLGILKDVLGSFSSAIRICGALMVFGGMFFALEPLARKLEDRKTKKSIDNV